MVQKRNIQNEIILALIRGKAIHLRALSKIIGYPHSTTSREIKRLKHRNIVNYEAVGRNKVVSLKEGVESMYVVYQAEYYKTLQLIEKHQAFSIILENILTKAASNLIILFGSYAKGNEKKDSDIDLFVETDDRKAREQVSNINSKLNVKIGKFDIHSPLGKEIIKNHIIIKGVELFYEKNPIFD